MYCIRVFQLPSEEGFEGFERFEVFERYELRTLLNASKLEGFEARLWLRLNKDAISLLSILYLSVSCSICICNRKKVTISQDICGLVIGFSLIFLTDPK
jgi:hypothetical protein